MTIADRPAIRTVLTTVSEATNQPEQIEVYTTLSRNGTVLYGDANWTVPVGCASARAHRS